MDAGGAVGAACICCLGSVSLVLLGAEGALGWRADAGARAGMDSKVGVG